MPDERGPLQPRVEPFRLGQASAALAGDVLARAFFDDPMEVFIHPDEVRRQTALPAIFAAAVRQGCAFGEVYALGKPDAVAIWALPNATAPTPDQAMVANAMATDQMDAGDRRRLVQMVEYLEALRQRLAPSPHWYLDVLGVDPPKQGMGLGGALLQPVLRRADQAGIGCYLETFKERNLPFYHRYGFSTLPEQRLPDAGPRFWPMVREPGRDRSAKPISEPEGRQARAQAGRGLPLRRR